VASYNNGGGDGAADESSDGSGRSSIDDHDDDYHSAAKDESQSQQPARATRASKRKPKKMAAVKPEPKNTKNMPANHRNQSVSARNSSKSNVKPSDAKPMETEIGGRERASLRMAERAELSGPAKKNYSYSADLSPQPMRRDPTPTSKPSQIGIGFQGKTPNARIWSFPGSFGSEGPGSGQ